MGNKQNTQVNDHGFCTKTEIDEVLKGGNFENKHVFITGCNRGIGLEIVNAFLKKSAIVSMACRNEKEMQIKKEELLKINGFGKIFCFVLDLGSLESVKNCVKAFSKEELPKIDYLINNGAVRCIKKGRTKDNFEKHIGINYFGHVYLTYLLFEHISEVCRIVNVSSHGHKSGKIDLDDINYEKRKYSSLKAYGISKLAVILFSREFNKRLKSNNKKITVFSVSPGLVSTEMTKESGYFYGRKVVNLFGKNIKQGAGTIVFPLVIEDSSKYAGKFLADYGVSNKLSKDGSNDELALQLFDFTEKTLDIKFDKFFQ